MVRDRSEEGAREDASPGDAALAGLGEQDVVNETFRGTPLKERAERVGGSKSRDRGEEGAGRGPSTQASEGARVPGPAAVEIAPNQGGVPARPTNGDSATEMPEDAVLDLCLEIGLGALGDSLCAQP